MSRWLLLALLGAGAFAGCAGDGPASPSGPAPGGAATVPPPEYRPDASWYECQGSDQAFVRRAHLAVLGRRPSGQAEVNVWTDLIAAIDALDGGAPPGSGKPGEMKRSLRVVTDALTRDPGYMARWVDFFRDALRVQRIDVQANPDCYDNALRTGDPGWIEQLRTRPPSSPGDGKPFTMRDVMEASLQQDDLAPLYVANLFAMHAKSYTGANADPVRRELARRSEFGAWFGASYLHRDGVCMGCHNSEFSTTFSDDPALNRHFPLPGRFESALFDLPTGPEPRGEYDGITRMQGVHRFAGFADAHGGAHPWGMALACGDFVPQEKLSADPAGVDAKFGPVSGDRASVWGLAASLQAGFEKLRERGLARGADGTIGDPDQAFAYLVAATVSEKVWTETVGTPLTIALYFPRNAAARDQLLALTEAFVASGFSHKALLRAVLGSPAFNLAAPDAGCGSRPYALPALFDPWTTADKDPERHGNSPADGVAFLTSRTLLRATRSALGWSSLWDADFPANRGDPNADFQAEIGVFLRNVEPGFRGFDFQSLLAWEAKTGGCARPALAARDALDDLLDEARQTPGARVSDLALALKDRLVGEPAFGSEAERAAVEAILGPLDAPASGLGPEADGALREVCGALLSSPPFLLQGVVPPDTRAVPAVSLPPERYDAVCARIAERGLPEGLRLVCEQGWLRVE